MLILVFVFISFARPCLADIYSFPEKDLHLSVGVEVQDYSLGLKNTKSGQEVTYSPNVSSLVIPKISYRGLWGLSWAFKQPLAEGDANFYGETDYTDIRFDFTFHSFSVGTYYSQYRGFYIDNSEQIDTSLTKVSPRIRRSDLYSRNFGASLIWVWDDHTFSMPNLMSQTERQEKSGGSLLFGGSFSETNFRADSSLIPAEVSDRFELLNGLRAGKLQMIHMNIGYGYSLAEKWFIGGIAQAGPGLTSKKLEYDNGSRQTGFEPSLRLEVMASGGYNGDQFFTSIKVKGHNDIFIISNASAQISKVFVALGLNVGIHLESIGI